MATGSDPAAPARPSLIYQLPSYVERLELTRLFPAVQPLEVELGSGDGSFLAQWAQLRPGHNFLGIERLMGRLRKLDRKGRRAGLSNLRALRIEAAYCVEYLLPLDSVCAFHIYFPDPWPKRKHWKNRLVGPRFPEIAARVMEAGGKVYLRTDDADYFAQMNEVLGDSSCFRTTETPPELTAVVTDFEQEFQARGVVVWRAAYQRQ